MRAVAQRFGGGGHMNASGFTSNDPIETVRTSLLPLCATPSGDPALDRILIVDKPGHDVA